jgi:hypothetical protein
MQLIDMWRKLWKKIRQNALPIGVLVFCLILIVLPIRDYRLDIDLADAGFYGPGADAGVDIYPDQVLHEWFANMLGHLMPPVPEDYERDLNDPTVIAEVKTVVPDPTVYATPVVQMRMPSGHMHDGDWYGDTASEVQKIINFSDGTGYMYPIWAPLPTEKVKAYRCLVCDPRWAYKTYDRASMVTHIENQHADYCARHYGSIRSCARYEITSGYEKVLDPGYKSNFNGIASQWAPDGYPEAYPGDTVYEALVREYVRMILNKCDAKWGNPCPQCAAWVLGNEPSRSEPAYGQARQLDIALQVTYEELVDAGYALEDIEFQVIELYTHKAESKETLPNGNPRYPGMTIGEAVMYEWENNFADSRVWDLDVIKTHWYPYTCSQNYGGPLKPTLYPEIDDITGDELLVWEGSSSQRHSRERPDFGRTIMRDMGQWMDDYSSTQDMKVGVGEFGPSCSCKKAGDGVPPTYHLNYTWGGAFFNVDAVCIAAESGMYNFQRLALMENRSQFALLSVQGDGNIMQMPVYWTYHLMTQYLGDKVVRTNKKTGYGPDLPAKVNVHSFMDKNDHLKVLLINKSAAYGAGEDLVVDIEIDDSAYHIDEGDTTAQTYTLSVPDGYDFASLHDDFMEAAYEDIVEDTLEVDQQFHVTVPNMSIVVIDITLTENAGPTDTPTPTAEETYTATPTYTNTPTHTSTNTPTNTPAGAATATAHAIAEQTQQALDATATVQAEATQTAQAIAQMTASYQTAIPTWTAEAQAEATATARVQQTATAASATETAIAEEEYEITLVFTYDANRSGVAKPDPVWAEPIEVKIFNYETSALVEHYEVSADQNGVVTRTVDIPIGVMTMYVRGETTLWADRALVWGGGGVGSTWDLGTISLTEADANQDNHINVLDFSILSSTYGYSAGDPDYDERADFNKDDTVSVLDFSILSTYYGSVGDAPPY